MNLLCSMELNYNERRRVINDFFLKTRVAKRELETIKRLNRLQRSRCRANLLIFEEIEREFNRIDYTEDIEVLYNHLSRYLYLDKSDLIDILGNEEIRVKSLFLI